MSRPDVEFTEWVYAADGKIEEGEVKISEHQFTTAKSALLHTCGFLPEGDVTKMLLLPDLNDSGRGICVQVEEKEFLSLESRRGSFKIYCSNRSARNRYASSALGLPRDPNYRGI